MQPLRPDSALRALFVCLLPIALGACGWLPQRSSAPVEAPPVPEAADRTPLAPASAHRHALSEDTEVIGILQRTAAGRDDTLSDIARRFDLGLDELLLANPDVDPWLPGEGTPIVLPSAHVLPHAPRVGIVINLAALRLYYYPPPGADGTRYVLTHPIGIGRLGWATPTGATHVSGKARDPTWYVPASVRREHAEAGDPLPAVVPPGPENPLGAHVLTLGLPGYLIHGTNKPNGVGMRVSHGCIRLYPEDIAALFEQIPIDLPVTIVNQPYLAGWRDGELYFEAHGLLEDDERAWHQALLPEIDRALLAAPRDRDAVLDWQLVGELARSARGLPVPVLANRGGLAALLAGARPVHNRLPEDSNWDGRVEYRMPEEELEALLDGRVPAPLDIAPETSGAAAADDGGPGEAG